MTRKRSLSQVSVAPTYELLTHLYVLWVKSGIVTGMGQRGGLVALEKRRVAAPAGAELVCSVTTAPVLVGKSTWDGRVMLAQVVHRMWEVTHQ
jgi:hypothetical protein